MRSTLEWTLYAVVLAGAFGLVTAWQTRDMLSIDGTVTIAPTTLPKLSGGTAVLGPDATRATLVYFFAPWCSICRMSIGNLDGIDESEIQIFVVALDYSDLEDVYAFTDSVGLEREVLLGNDDLRALFKIRGYPSYYILDNDFTIVNRDMGYSSAVGLRRRAWQAGF